MVTRTRAAALLCVWLTAAAATAQEPPADHDHHTASDAAWTWMIDANVFAGFNENFKVLYGDVTGDGYVSSADVIAITNASRSSYNIFADLNGDGTVDTVDAQIARLLIGSKLP